MTRRSACLAAGLGLLALAAPAEAADADAQVVPPAAEAAAAAAAGSAEEPAAEADEEGWDPYLGMDRSGRIPRVEKPVENPERWRYIPEGRIMPGNVLQRFLVSSFISPLFFRDEDIGFGGGLALIDIDFRQKRRREFAAIFGSYTTEGQQNYSISWRRWIHHIDLPDGGVLQEERSFLRARGGYSKTLTLRFFGLGGSTPESNETSYQDELFAFSLGVQGALPEPGGDWILGVGVRGEFHRLSDGAKSGVPSTRELFPVLFDEARDVNLGYLELELRWDTRDSQANPYSGWEIGGKVDAALLQSGGDPGAVFSLLATRAFRVWPIFHEGGDPSEENPPTDTLAFALETATSTGELPFFALPSLGGSNRLRGFIGNRFTDRASWFFGAEWRLWVIPRGFHVPYTRAIRVERVGVAPFFEMGGVAGDWPELFQTKVQLSYGIGLRIALERSAIFRVDFGFSDEGLNTILRFGLSF